MSAPFPRWPIYEEDEVEAVVRVLRSGQVNYWTGEEGRAFEREFAGYVGRRHGVALANGTVALEVALRSLGIGEGDDVIVTPRSFVASASCVLLCGARPVFADVDENSQNLTAGTIEAALTPRTKAVVIVHLAGWPCDMDGIMDLARERGLKVVEDCAQAHGARYKGKPVGSFGEVATFSFCQDKIMSTGGEGGMLLCDDDTVWRRAWSYKDHGKDYEAMRAEGNGVSYNWPHASLGNNYRMTEMQAAIGRIQLENLDDWVARRRRNAGILRKALTGMDACRVPEPPADIEHAYYKFYLFVDAAKLRNGWNRDRIALTLRERGVPCGSGACPELYREKTFARVSGLPDRGLPVAQRLGEQSLMLEVHPGLSASDMEAMAARVREVMEQASV